MTLTYTRVPPTCCESCGSPLDAATSTDTSNSVPKEGDVSICIVCLAVSIYRADQTMRPVTDNEWIAFTAEERREIQRAQDVLKKVKRG